MSKFLIENLGRARKLRAIAICYVEDNGFEAFQRRIGLEAPRGTSAYNFAFDAVFLMLMQDKPVAEIDKLIEEVNQEC